LITDPAAALQAKGIDVPNGITVTMVENTEKVITHPLPLASHL
jgi:hypothetical protein